jgi:phosphate:Na+ symporter
MGVHIAMLHTISNTANTLILLPFTRQYARFLTWLIREKPGEKAAIKPSYEAVPLVRLPELNLVHARNEIGNMAQMVGEMFGRYCEIRVDPPKDMESELERFKAWETYADSMREGLSRFILAVLEQDVSESTRESIGAMLRTVTELENITDSCLNLAFILDRSVTKKITFKSAEMKGLEPYILLVKEAIFYVKENVPKGLSEEGLKKALELEEQINASRLELRRLARRRLNSGADAKSELVFIDVIRHVEKIGDFAFAASEALREMR